MRKKLLFTYRSHDSGIDNEAAAVWLLCGDQRDRPVQGSQVLCTHAPSRSILMCSPARKLSRPLLWGFLWRCPSAVAVDWVISHWANLQPLWPPRIAERDRSKSPMAVLDEAIQGPPAWVSSLAYKRHSSQSGNSQGFRSSVPRTVERPRIFFIILQSGLLKVDMLPDSKWGLAARCHTLGKIPEAQVWW